MRKISKIKGVKGRLRLPSDKSISHRLFIFSAISSDESEVIVDRIGKDVETTISALISLGTQIEKDGNTYKITPKEFLSPISPLYMGNSGTTTRLLTGLLSAYKPHLDVVFYGDESLSRRPMRRVISPLMESGARILSREDNYLPMFIKGSDLRSIDYTLPIPSAQVKSALTLAALFGDTPSFIGEPIPSRDHTERFLSYMGVNIHRDGERIVVNPGLPGGIRYRVPGDFSQAAFFITLALITEGELLLEDVNLNPTRIGFLDKVLEMGANIKIKMKEEEPEPIGDLMVYGGSELKGITIRKEDIPLMVDEVPLFAILGAFSKDGVIVTGAEELRVKESDRISAVVEEFSKLGIKIEELSDGFIVRPSGIRGGCSVDSRGDHRIAMALTILGMVAEKPISLIEDEAVDISYPDFFSDIASITL